MTPEEMQEMFGDGDPFSDFFHTFFGGAAAGARGRDRRGRARPQRGQDLEPPVDLTLEEAFAGTTRRLVIVARRHGAHGRSAHSRRRQGRRARARRRRRRGRRHGGGKAGDLYLVVRVLPHSQFERRGQDLYVHVRGPGDDRRARRRSRSCRRSSGSTLRLKVPELTRGRPRVPPARSRHADRRQARRARRPVRDGRRADSGDV